MPVTTALVPWHCGCACGASWMCVLHAAHALSPMLTRVPTSTRARAPARTPAAPSPDLEMRDASGRHALHYAAMHGHVDAAVAIYNLTDGNLYAQDGQQRSALHLACLDGHTHVARLLIDLGSNVNALDYRYDSPLHLACQEGHAETVRMLVWCGADPWQQNFLKQQPIDVAEKWWQRPAYYFLEQVMGEKCIFDRLPDAMFHCGKRHPDEPVEMYHRLHAEELAPYKAPEDTPWADEAKYYEETVARLRSTPQDMSAKAIYEDRSVWERALKTPVDLFPGAGSGRGAGEAGGCSQGAAGGGGEGEAVEEEDSFATGDGEWISHGARARARARERERDRERAGAGAGWRVRERECVCS